MQQNVPNRFIFFLIGKGIGVGNFIFSMWITIYGEKVVEGKHALSMSLGQKMGKNR
jgi:hypothetical protein